MEVLPDMFSSLVLASYWQEEGNRVSVWPETQHRLCGCALKHLCAALPTEEHVGGNGLRVCKLLPGLAGLGHGGRHLRFSSAGESGTERRETDSSSEHPVKRPEQTRSGGGAAPLPLSDRLNAGDGDLLLRLLLLQSPGGGEGGGPSLRVPPGPESVSHCERVVLVSANGRVLISTNQTGTGRRPERRGGGVLTSGVRR